MSTTPAAPPRDPADQRLGPRRAKAVIIFFFAWAAVVSAFYGWRGTHTEKADLGTKLQQASDPKAMQDAAIELAARIKQHDAEAQKWYPTLIAMTTNSSPDVRGSAAWIMANDPTNEQFHQALLRLTKDPSPSVRANAAVSLAKAKDSAGHQALVEMLQSSDSEQQWEALRALRVVGTGDDLPAISRYTNSPDRRLREAAKDATQGINDRL